MRCKVIEIWLNTANPLTEPKWTKGNLRDNIDPSSLFQNIIQVTDIDAGLHSVRPGLRRMLMVGVI